MVCFVHVWPLLLSLLSCPCLQHNYHKSSQHVETVFITALYYTLNFKVLLKVTDSEPVDSYTPYVA